MRGFLEKKSVKTQNLLNMRKIETVNFVFQPFNNAFLKTLLILPYLKSTLKCAEKQNKKEVLKKIFYFFQVALLQQQPFPAVVLEHPVLLGLFLVALPMLARHLILQPLVVLHLHHHPAVPVHFHHGDDHYDPWHSGLNSLLSQSVF
jgi:hypothetical protein